MYRKKETINKTEEGKEKRGEWESEEMLKMISGFTTEKRTPPHTHTHTHCNCSLSQVHSSYPNESHEVCRCKQKQPGR